MNIKHRDFSGAIFFLFIGTIFLLNTTGMVDWGIWLYILKFWPLLLVLAGLKLIFGKSLLGELLVTVIALILYISVGVISYSAYTGEEYSVLPKQLNRCITKDCGNFWGKGKDVQTVTQAIPIIKDESYKHREFDFSIGAAKFLITDSINDNHILGTLTYDKELIEPYFEKKFEEGKLTVSFNTKLESQFLLHPRNKTEYLFEIGAIENIPTNFTFEIGASQGEVTLDQTLIDKFDASIGAGSLDIDLSEKSIPIESISIDVGAGRAVLTLPKEVAYEISYDLGIGNISIDGNDIATFAGSEESWKSNNYDLALQKVKLNINVGVGTFEIRSK